MREKCPNTEFFLVRIFPYSDWTRRDTPYLSIFSPNAGKYGPEKTPYLDTFLASFKLNAVSDMKAVLFGRTYEIIIRSSYFKMIMYITTARRKIWENAVRLKYVVFLHIFGSATVFIRIKCRTKMQLWCLFKIFIGNGLLTIRDV